MQVVRTIQNDCAPYTCSNKKTLSIFDMEFISEHDESGRVVHVRPSSSIIWSNLHLWLISGSLRHVMCLPSYRRVRLQTTTAAEMQLKHAVGACEQTAEDCHF